MSVVGGGGVSCVGNGVVGNGIGDVDGAVGVCGGIHRSACVGGGAVGHLSVLPWEMLGYVWDVGVCDGVGVGDGVVCAGVDVGDDRWRGVPSARSRTTLEPALSMLAVSVRSSQHSVI